MKKETFRFKVFSLRNLETPFYKKGCKDYYCVVDVKNLPDLGNWREINVRDPKLTGSVPRKIEESFHDNTEMFVFMNRGILVSVESVSFDPKTSEVIITMGDKNKHGLGDGGHTYTIIRNELEGLKDKEETQYVKMELLEGFSLDEIALVVEGRNTSNQVKDQSIMELTNKFEAMKEHLPKLMQNRIAFSEYELDTTGTPKPVSIKDVVALLTAFNKDYFTDSTQPVLAYSSKQACLERFKQDPHSYEKLYPIAKDILLLHDHIYEAFADLYSDAAKKAGKSWGNLGKVTGVSTKGTQLYFNGRKSSHTIPSGFIYPMLAAFRAFLEEKKGVYVWGKGINVFELVKSDLAVRLMGIITDEALKNQNPNKTGKSALLWQTCYQNAEIYYLRMK